jgi:hypothetical protein
MFSENFVLQALQFLHQDRFDLVRFAGAVSRLDITKLNYEFGRSPTKESRLSAVVQFSPGLELGGSLTATFGNCPYLERVITQRLIPQFRVFG